MGTMNTFSEDIDCACAKQVTNDCDTGVLDLKEQCSESARMGLRDQQAMMKVNVQNTLVSENGNCSDGDINAESQDNTCNVMMDNLRESETQVPDQLISNTSESENMAAKVENAEDDISAEENFDIVSQDACAVKGNVVIVLQEDIDSDVIEHEANTLGDVDNNEELEKDDVINEASEDDLIAIDLRDVIEKEEAQRRDAIMVQFVAMWLRMVGNEIDSLGATPPSSPLPLMSQNWWDKHGKGFN